MTAPTMTPGDILLHYNKGIVSDLIRFFDGSDYSHSSLVFDPQTVAESNAHGIGANPLPPAIAAGKYTDTYRLVSSPVAFGPVLARATYYVGIGDRYAFEALLFLAVLCTTRRIPLPGIVRILLRKILDAAANILNTLIAAGREPMICSEFVYRCFDEALPATSDEYAIVVGVYASQVLLTSTSSVPALTSGKPGIHKDSLLALAAKRRQVTAFTLHKDIKLAPLAAATTDAAIADLSDAAAAYLTAAAAGPTADWLTPADLAADPEIIARLDRLVTLARPTTPKVSPAAFLTPEAQLSLDYASFSQAVADFVTPKDLCSSSSLVRVGRTPGAA
jgi:hypothetical protein